MADFNDRALRAAPVSSVDAGLRAYMVRVYNYMFLGLIVTGLVAYATYQASVVTAAGSIVGLTPFGQTLFNSPLRLVVAFSPLVLVFALRGAIPRLSAGAALMSFLGFAAVLGLSLSYIFLAYTMTSIGMVFFITAAMFGGMSLYGYTTRSDLTGWGSFLIMGMFGIVIASVVNYWLQSQMLMFVYSCAGVIIFTGITAFYTQRIKEMYSVQDDGTVTGRKAIYGALLLYISFLNLFTSLLNLLGGRR
ncbi:MAG TPA: Bax inhibitor-1/YccA family protein [Rhizomicrobium sp.]|jgi:hypothetical protein